ncbi:splicing factor, suppressor of white-apricot homolog [Megalops cyprinoides]|uniref:splicing factor, suppressor of white-apricot homolog n=1 Tax=Megalops cyprinoides TaxID=118141 RepID=UPI001863A12B|nr:splicing factor, suppressor of white-apricot homolog [Megalops cyprinoides]
MYRRGGGKKEHGRTAKEEGDGGKYSELLVFGYACKLFRDDERALYHEQGKHLIPWMGDKNITIDRYDGRGHLHDLSEYDAGSWNRAYQLSEEEARIEALCDEERYLALHTDLLEEEARQEEEYKRLSEALADEGTYNAVGYRYSADYYDPSQPTEEEDASKDTEEEPEPQESEEPFVAPPGLVVPPDVELPATVKMHAIIERTANFVCKQGAQFEIVLKAKQSRNSQFDFLRFDHYLNPYYKHVLRAMKEGRYTPVSEAKQETQEESQSDDSDDDNSDGNYLHPSLFATKKSSRLEEIMKPLQVMDPDHPLAALVRKARQDKNGAAAVATEQAEGGGEVASATPTPAAPDYAADPNVAAMYYGYCMLPDGTYCLAPPPPGMDATTYYSSLPGGVMPPPSASSVPPPPGTTPPPPPDSVSSAPTPAPSQVPLAAPAVTPATSSRSQAPVAAIIPPPPDVQPVIDKLAEYVARNGLKFEASVRSKNDPRFEFLQSWHQYNTYYEFKKHYFMQKEGISLAESGSPSDNRSVLEGAVSAGSGAEPDAAAGSMKPPSEGKLVKASFAPICFAIKAKENDMLPLEKNRVRLDDDSDDDQEKEAGQEGGVAAVGAVVIREAPPVPVPEERKPALTLEELEAKQAKQKLEDRLAAAAREKLAQASKESKEKQLQAERKRKAALFLQTLRGPLTAEPEARRPDEPPAPPEVSVHPPLLPGGRVAPVRSKEPPTAPLPPSSSSSSSSRGQEREKKKKKHKKRSRTRSRSRSRCRSRSRSSSRSRSRSKTKHALPSAYRTVRKSRSRSRSPGRRERGARSSERRREERERERERDRYVPSAYRLGNSPGFSKKRSRSRSPHEKRKRKSSKSHMKPKASSCSPSSSPGRAGSRKRASAHSVSPSPSGSPASSLERSRGGSLEKDKQVSSAIVSSVQTKITQDLMAKVRAMLAASKDMRSGTS